MHVVTCVLFVGVGTLLFWICFASSLPSPVRWSIMMILRALPRILSCGLLVLFPRGVGWFMQCAILLRCPGPAPFWHSHWISLLTSAVTAEDVDVWPYSVGFLVKWVTFMGTLHWLAAGADLAVGGISNLEMPKMYELWAGERLVLEKALPRYLRPTAPNFSVGCSFWSRH